MKIPSFMPNKDWLVHVQQLRETLGHDKNHIYDSSTHTDSTLDTKVAIVGSRIRMNDKIRQKHLNHRKSYSTKYTRLEKNRMMLGTSVVTTLRKANSFEKKINSNLYCTTRHVRDIYIVIYYGEYIATSEYESHLDDKYPHTLSYKAIIYVWP